MHPSAHFDLRYPMGRMPLASSVAFLAQPDRQEAVQHVAGLPACLSSAVSDLSPAQLDSPYRDGGWTLRQVAHHVADSHLNAYTRLRLALTEDWPTIRPYEEARWAELADARTLPVEVSLSLLAPLHARWIALLGSLAEGDWERGYVHPVLGRTTIDAMTAIYSWHGRHHTAHVLALRTRQGW